jgi:hypothetical protein
MIRKIILVLSLYIIFFGFLSLTQPQHVPLIVLVAPFIIMTIAFYLSVCVLLTWLMPGIALSKRRFFSSSVAGFCVFMVVLSSVNQLTARDFLLMALLSVCLLLYIGRVNFTKR